MKDAAVIAAPVPAAVPQGRTTVLGYGSLLRTATPWLLFLALLLAAPRLFPGDLALSILSQIGIAIVICLSYNILLGQGGMLSFGHAVYSGMGAFAAVHSMNASGWLHVPIVAVPLVGGCASLLCACLFGYVTTKKSGTTFAMITLGIGELVASMSLMLPEFFGGEGGITADRTASGSFLGLSFGPQVQVYYLIAAYCFVCTVLMFVLTCTPLGRMLNAVRDNPQRVEFIGYRTQHVRYLAFLIAAFFAGIGGGLAAINFEIVTSEVVGGARSGAYLLFVYVGGTGVFYGPIIGAVLMVLALVLLSEISKAWLLYLGIAFIAMVMYAPGGVAQILRSLAGGVARWRTTWRAGLLVTLAAAATATAFVAVVEMLYLREANADAGATLSFLGLVLHPSTDRDWALVLLALAVCTFAFGRARRAWIAAADGPMDTRHGEAP